MELSEASIHEELRQAITRFSYKENHNEMFTLASGKKSPYYFDLKQTLLNPPYLRMAAILLWEKISGQNPLPVAAGGLTMGADPLLYALSLLADEKNQRIYPLVVRKASKDHGSKKRVEGLLHLVPPHSEQHEVVLVDDVITTGASTIQALEVLREQGLVIKRAYCIVDRKEGGAEALAKLSVTLSPVFTLEDFKVQK